MCQLAINFEFVEESKKKKEKSISDLLLMALPERVVAGLSTSSSSMKATSRSVTGGRMSQLSSM